MNFQPLRDQILVKLQTKQYTGAIQLLSNDASQESVVVASGPGYHCENTGEFIPNVIKVGDIVMHAKNCGQSLTIEGETFNIMRERDVFGIIFNK